MLNGAHNELLTVKAQMKAQERLLHVFEKKTDRLEQAYEFHHEQMTKIEQKVDKILEKFSEDQGVVRFKKNLFKYGNSLITLVLAITASNYFPPIVSFVFKMIKGG